MQYSKTIFDIAAEQDFVRDVLMAQLAELGYDSFEENAGQLCAYIPTENYQAESVAEMLRDFPYEGVRLLETVLCEDKDWNEEWEKNYFQPILIGTECVIHSPFHKDIPVCQYDIVINPKMAFGTGHHQTTSLMLAQILGTPLEGKTVLDMGCGTCILGLLAAMRGAKRVTAIDIDDWCTENAAENILLNEPKVRREQFEVLTGDARLLAGRQFDVIFANINRNILLQDMEHYVACLQAGGLLFISGFYSEDRPLLVEKATSLGLREVACQMKDNWTMLKLVFDR